MDHDTKVERSAREARSSSSHNATFREDNDCKTSSPQQDSMRQAASSATVQAVPPPPKIGAGTAPHVSAPAFTECGRELPPGTKASFEDFIVPTSKDKACDSGDDGSTEAPTESVSPPPVARCSVAPVNMTNAPTAGGKAPAAAEVPRISPQTDSQENVISPAITSSSGVLPHQVCHHPPKSTPIMCSPNPSVAIVLPDYPETAVADPDEGAGEQSTTISSQAAEEQQEQRDSPLSSGRQMQEDDHQQRQEKQGMAHAAATSALPKEGGGMKSPNVQQQQLQDSKGGAERAQEGTATTTSAVSTLMASKSVLSPSSPPYVSQQQRHEAQHTREYQIQNQQGAFQQGVANDGRFVDAASRGQFPGGFIPQPTFANHDAYPRPPVAAMQGFYRHHTPLHHVAGMPPPHGGGLPYQSYSGFTLPDSGRAPLLPARPGQGGGRFDLVHPDANYDHVALHQQHQHHHQHPQVWQQHFHQPHQISHQQQHHGSGMTHSLAFAAARGAATPITPLGIPTSASPVPTDPPPASAQLSPNTFASASAGAPQTPNKDSRSGSLGGGVRGGIPPGALGTVAGVIAAVAAAGAGPGGGADGDAMQNNVYNDIGLVVTRTKELEKIMKDLFQARGSGLNELLSSLQTDRRIDPRTQQRIRSIAAMRNKLVHSVDANKLTMSNTFGASARRAFKMMCDDLEISLRECASKVVEDPFEQATRPADAFRLGNHPAFRGIGGMGGGTPGDRDCDYDEAAAIAEAEAAAVAQREQEAVIVVKDTARFPHNLITAKRQSRRNQDFTAPPAPDMNDEASFPDIGFASSAAVVQQSKRARGGLGPPEDGGGVGGAGGDVAADPSQSGGTSVDAGRDGAYQRGQGWEEDGRWDGQGRIEEAQIISGRGVCRTLGQGEVGYVATTHTMSGVYRKWDCMKRNPMGAAWKIAPKAFTNTDKEMPEHSSYIPGASKGQVAFQARGLDLRANRPAVVREKAGRRPKVASGGGSRPEDEVPEEQWEAFSKARKRRGQKETRATPHSYVVRKVAAAPFWLSPGVQFGRSNCRGWFPTRQDWSCRGIPQCIYVPLEPSTEDRVDAMRSGHERVVGLTLEEDEERLMRIAIRESAAESRRAYEKKYGTEAEREKRREAQAKARVKAMAEHESLQREEEDQLTEVIKASLAESLIGAAEKDDRDVIASIEASRWDGEENEDPEVLKVMAESRRQHEAMQETLRVHGGMSAAQSHNSAAAEATVQGVYSEAPVNHHSPPIYTAIPPVAEDQSVPVLSAAPPPPPPPPPSHFLPVQPQAQQQSAQPPVTMPTELPLPAPVTGNGQALQARFHQRYYGQVPPGYESTDGFYAAPPPPSPPADVPQPSLAGQHMGTLSRPQPTMTAQDANSVQQQQQQQQQPRMMPAHSVNNDGFAGVPPPPPPLAHGATSHSRQPLAFMSMSPRTLGYHRAGAVQHASEGQAGDNSASKTLDHERPPFAQQKHQPHQQQQQQQHGWRGGDGAVLQGPMTGVVDPKPEVVDSAAVEGGAQLAGWAVRTPPPGGAVYWGSAAATRGENVTWGATGQASDGLSAEERELAAALEASRLADECRQREEAESKLAMDLALKLSMMETAPYGGGRFERDNGNCPAKPTLAKPAPTHIAPDHRFERKRGKFEGHQPPARPALNAIGRSAPPSVGPLVTAGSGDSILPMHGGSGSGGVPGSYSAAGGPVAWQALQQHQRYQTTPHPKRTRQQADRPTKGTSTATASSGASKSPSPSYPNEHEHEDEDKDEAARELRLALEEEERHYGTGTGTREAAAAAEAGAAGGGVAVGGGQQQHDELAWALEQSRLEDELQKSRLVVAEEGEEEMVARVLEESRLEQERANAELLELQKAMQASLSLSS